MKRFNSTDDAENPVQPSGSNTPTPSGSEALLNHSSILIKFVSLIIITIFLKYI